MSCMFYAKLIKMYIHISFQFSVRCTDIKATVHCSASKNIFSYIYFKSVLFFNFKIKVGLLLIYMHIFLGPICNTLF